MLSVGIAAIGEEKWWPGGHYYLHHLIRCVDSLKPEERVILRDVWWINQPESDPFKDVRDLMGKPVVVSPPTGLAGRLLRKLRKTFNGTKGAKDLFDSQGIDVVFPRPPCENLGTPYVFWLPDFQYLHRPDLMSDGMRLWFVEQNDKHVHAAAQVVLSSEDARDDFVRAFPEVKDKAHVVRFCSVPDPGWWRLDPKNVAAQYGLPEHFLIVCNQFTRHKNHLTLIRALAVLKKEGRADVHLVCTGSTLDFRHEDYVGQVRKLIEQNDLVGQVHILGLIPRADQIALLRRSVAVLQPSWFEGWSTIIEDAKTLGKPVIASDLPVHREQLGQDQPCYLSLDDAQEWADAIGTAWARHEPGPNLQEEKLGLERLENAKRECGLAFVKAMQSALTLHVS
jgi:glycosyltransferase involved in cell wall biosynthesis